MDTPVRWSLTSRLLHWVMAVLILFQLGMGLAMAEFVGDVSRQFALTQTHKSLGFVAFVLVLVRIGWRVANRRRPDWHKRLMLLATISMLTPAIARIPIDALQAGGILAFMGVTDLFAIACIGWDTAKNRRLHPAFLRGGLFLVLSHPAMLALAGSAFWMEIARRIVG